MTAANRMVTKRQLGIVTTSIGTLACIASIGVDLLGAGEWQGIGPLQRAGILSSMPVILVGVLLILIGNRPA
jgi:hypothetical protein